MTVYHRTDLVTGIRILDRLIKEEYKKPICPHTNYNIYVLTITRNNMEKRHLYNLAR